MEINQNKKVRKVTAGPIKNKERTMNKILNAVKTVLNNKGYAGLSIVNIAKAANVDRKLIYLYFGSLENLIETYIQDKDFWNRKGNVELANLADKKEDISADIISSILSNQFESFYENTELQKMILWEISEQSKTMSDLANEREELGNALFNLTDNAFKNSNINQRAMFALLVGGIYYLNLQAKSGNSTFCGLDFNQQKNRQLIKTSIDQMVHFAYDKAKENK